MRAHNVPSQQCTGRARLCWVRLSYLVWMWYQRWDIWIIICRESQEAFCYKVSCWLIFHKWLNSARSMIFMSSATSLAQFIINRHIALSLEHCCHQELYSEREKPVERKSFLPALPESRLDSTNPVVYICMLTAPNKHLGSFWQQAVINFLLARFPIQYSGVSVL